MNEFARSIIFLLVDIAIVAVFIEGLKKLAGEMTLTTAGHWTVKTVLKKTTIVTLAGLLSFITVAISYIGGALYGKKILVVLYSMVVFFGQYFFDMKLLKRLVEKLIEKAINKI